LEGKAITISITVPPFSSKIYTKTISAGGGNFKTGEFNENSISTLQNSSLTISPVPAQAGNKICIQYPFYMQESDNTKLTSADYSIMDMTGKEVNKGTADFNTFNLIEIPTNGISQGAFIIKLITGTILKTAKIILN
jgi:hypothetical protein